MPELTPAALRIPLVHHRRLVCFVEDGEGGHGVGACQFSARRIEERRTEACRAAVAAVERFEVGVDEEAEVAVGAIGGYGAQRNVADMKVRGVEEGYVAVDATEAPAVLVLEI